MNTHYTLKLFELSRLKKEPVSKESARPEPVEFHFSRIKKNKELLRKLYREVKLKVSPLPAPHTKQFLQNK